MVFSDFAYGPGTFVRCDVCRDPEALMEARAGSQLIFTSPSPMGTDEATERALAHGFVRRGYQVLCRGCAVAATLPPDAPEELVALNERGRVWMLRPHA